MYIRRSYNEAFQEYIVKNKPTSRSKRPSVQSFRSCRDEQFLRIERSGEMNTDYTDRRTYITADAQFKHIYTSSLNTTRVGL